MRVRLHPEDPGKPNNSIEQVVAAQYKYLPARGIELVPYSSKGDLQAVHILPPAIGSQVDVLHCHGLYPTGQRELPAWAWGINRDIINTVRTCRVLTVPSPWVAMLFARDMGFTPHIVPHGLEIDKWPEEYPTVGSRPRVLWNKNRPSDVCDVGPLQQLAALRPNWDFVTTFGDPTPNVKITGVVTHAAMKQIIYDSTVYFASTKETFGVGILEALAAGRPVLAWDWGNAPELVRHKVDGYLARPGDLDDTAAGLDYCLEHLDELARAARQRATEYPWTRAADLYAAAYFEALADKDREQGEEGHMVSVVIPCYNYANYVAQAIQSVKVQQRIPWELIVVDDGSKDSSLEVIKQTARDDPRVRVVSQPNAGVASARNRGALMARGEYLCFLDADDYLEPDALARMLPTLLAQPKLGISYGKLYIRLEPSGKRILSSWPSDFNFGQQLMQSNQIPTCCLVRKRAFFRAGGYRRQVIPAEDAELWARIGLTGYDAKLVSNQPVFYYRMHQKSVTHRIRSGQEPVPEWTKSLAAAFGGHEPIASVRKPARESHPVIDYDAPKASIVVPVGEGHQSLVEDAIESVYAQVDSRWELIVVDDTTDGHLEDYGVLPYKMRYPFIHWIRCGAHNASTARNIGAKAARGEYLVFLDADDMLHREFLKWSLLAAEDCGTNGAIWYTDWVSLPEKKDHIAENWDIPRLLDHALFAVTFLHPKVAFEEVRGFDETLPGWEDWDYTIKLAMHGYTGIRITKPLFYYRYDTGRRRRESLDHQDELLALIRGRYVGVTPMAGCGCRKKSAPAPQRAPVPTGTYSPPTLPPVHSDRPDGLIMMVFTGVAQARLYRGPSGATYRFGSGLHTRKPVNPGDVQFFERLPGFQREGAHG